MREVLPPLLVDVFTAAFERALASNEPERLEYSLEMEHERRFFEACVVRCDSDRLLSIVRDITDRKRAELDAAAQRQELAHLNRVLILAEQSGALAHELSQPLAAILANAQAARHLLDRTPLDLDELRETLDDVIKSDKRAGMVIHRLRELLKKSNAVLQPLDLNEVTREVLDLTHSDLLLRRMPITTALSPGIPPVLGDRVQLQQVILNLVINACDAMSTVDPTERELKLTTVADDECVQIAISDRGVGIPEGALDSVFDPFVTHRAEGLGLGLAISRSIVVAHRGRIHAENNADRGATFRCFLPLANGTADGVGRTMLADVASRKIDAAIVWGPIGGYFASQQPGEFRVVPLAQGTDPSPLAFEISMALRFGEAQWRARIEQFIRTHRAAVEEILMASHVPLLPLLPEGKEQ